MSTYSLLHSELDEYALAGVQSSPLSSDGYVSDVSSGIKPLSPAQTVQGTTSTSSGNSPQSMLTLPAEVPGSADTAPGQENLLDFAQLLQGDFTSAPHNQMPPLSSDVFIDLGMIQL